MATPKQLREAAKLQARLNLIDTKTDERIAKLRERFDAAVSAAIVSASEKRSAAIDAADPDVTALLGITANVEEIEVTEAIQ